MRITLSIAALIATFLVGHFLSHNNTAGNPDMARTLQELESRNRSAQVIVSQLQTELAGARASVDRLRESNSRAVSVAGYLRSENLRTDEALDRSASTIDQLEALARRVEARAGR
jgi:uncharacterized protein YlxW (UPF0749 family)